MHQMVFRYTCKRQNTQWPMIFLYNIIDVAAVNAFIVYSNTYPDYNAGVNYKRRLLLKDLTKELIIPHLQRRSQSINL